jgi:tRNA A58 N-methylase Trm61
MKLRNCRYLSRDILSELIQPGDTAVDATAGNGYDTLFLKQAVGPQGRVYAFDVQQAALDSTRRRLEEAGCLDDRVSLILDGHEHMARHVAGQARCVLFNLGWLPSGDHRVTTRTPTTLAAVRAAMGLLLPGGMVSVCIYPGHEEGARELLALLDALKDADIRQFNILHCNFLNQKNAPPQLILIQREG